MSRLPRTLTPVPQVPRLTTEAYNDGILRTAARATLALLVTVAARVVEFLRSSARVAYTVDSSCAAVVVPGKPVVKITSSTQLTIALGEYGLSRSTVTELPFDLDTSQAMALTGLFQGCSSLTSVPALDTSQATNLTRMFYGCSALTSAPDLDTSQATALTSMFQDCSSLTSVPALDTSQAMNLVSMFQGCSSLTSVPALDTSQARTLTGLFQGCSSLTSVPALDTSQARTLPRMFQGCSSLTSVPALDTSQATNLSSMFQSCSSLTDGNVRLIGKHPNAATDLMIQDSGLTREPFFDEQGNPI